MYSHCLFFFFFNDTATTEIYPLSLHDALPISMSSNSSVGCRNGLARSRSGSVPAAGGHAAASAPAGARCQRSEEHTSELQSQSNLVCRLLLEKKKKKKTT